MSEYSSSFNDSLLYPPDVPTIPFDVFCLTSRPGSFVFITFNIFSSLLLLPLCVLVLNHGLQQWRKKRSTSSAVTVSHSDIFTYHMVTMELIYVCGCGISCHGILMENLKTLALGSCLFSFTWFGQTFFHLLTCVERYLAVVHPITYRNLKTERGIRIRNISIGCVWLLSFVGMILDEIIQLQGSDLCALISSLMVVSFCSLSVLCALIRPGPGERGGDRERVDQSKLRAFYIITAILGVLLLRIAGGLTWSIGVRVSDKNGGCVTMMCEVWFNLPSSLLLPLLFVQRAGTLECCKKSIQ